jgi:lipoprotein-anchoring transpeptidase ErfK/SrfK
VKAKKKFLLSDIFIKKNNPQTAKWGSVVKPKKEISKNFNKSIIRNRGLKIVLIILLSITFVIILLASGAFAYNKVYENKIYPGIKIAGINCGGLTKSEAKSLLDSKLDTYKKENVTLSAKKQEWKPSFAKLGFESNSQETINNAIIVGRDNNIFVALKEQLNSVFYDNNLPIIYKLNEKTLGSYINSIGEKVNQPASNATLAFEGINLKVISAKKGSIIDKAILSKQIEEDLKFLKKENHNIPLKTDEPKVKEKDTQEAQKNAKIMVSAPINFTYENQIYTVEPDVIASWLTFTPTKSKNNSSDEEGSLKIPAEDNWYLTVGLNEDIVRQYLESTIGLDINVEPKNTKVTITDGQKFVLEQGYDGKSLDMDNTLVQTKDSLSKTDNRNISLIVKTIPAGEVEATSYGIVPITNEKYIDISLSSQVLTCFDGGKAQFVTLISSGIARYPTPAGRFNIYLKKVSTRMKGFYGPGNPDNYDLPDVPYAMFFSGDYSIHGTYWHNNFGTPMSHGCVNAPTSAASWIYDWSPVGTMVYVHW